MRPHWRNEFFGLNSAMSAPVNEPTNLAALSKHGHRVRLLKPTSLIRHLAQHRQNRDRHPRRFRSSPVVLHQPLKAQSVPRLKVRLQSPLRVAKVIPQSSIVMRQLTAYLLRWPMRLFVTKAISSQTFAVRPVKSV